MRESGPDGRTPVISSNQSVIADVHLYSKCLVFCNAFVGNTL